MLWTLYSYLSLPFTLPAHCTSSVWKNMALGYPLHYSLLTLNLYPLVLDSPILRKKKLWSFTLSIPLLILILYTFVYLYIPFQSPTFQGNKSPDHPVPPFNSSPPILVISLWIFSAPFSALWTIYNSSTKITLNTPSFVSTTLQRGHNVKEVQIQVEELIYFMIELWWGES